VRSDTDNSAKHWLMRAKEARAQASSMTDAQAKRTMLGIAATYEGLSRRMAQRAAKTDQPVGKAE
jgi:hypothetical protein